MKKIIVFLFFILNFICVYSQKISVDFQQDTARVEQMVRDMLKKNYSTAGMHAAGFALETEYDKLLNKYYQKLQDKLDENGKKALKEAQLSWIKFRDADKKLISKLGKNTGRGTMWGVIYGNYRVQITRERVFRLYQYLIADEFE